MSENLVAEYLGRLLNKSIATDSRVRLSSAQKSRFHAWLKSNNLRFNEELIGAEFSVGSIVGAGGHIPSILNDEVTIKTPDLSDGLEVSSDVSVISNGIGIDIQRISELFPCGLPTDMKADESLTKIFTLKELSYAETKGSSPETLTGIFAAKEAIQKIGGTGAAIPELMSLEILPDLAGKPTCKGFALSISHSGEYAVAIACELKRRTNVPRAEKIDLTQFHAHESPAKLCRPPSGIRLLDGLILALLGLVICFQIFLITRAS